MKKGRILAFTLAAAMLFSESAFTAFAAPVVSEEEEYTVSFEAEGEDEERAEANTVSTNGILTDEGVVYSVLPIEGKDDEYSASISFDTKSGGKFDYDMTALNIVSDLPVEGKSYKIVRITGIDGMPEKGRINKIIFDEGITSISASLDPSTTQGISSIVFPSTLKSYEGNSFEIGEKNHVIGTADWLMNAETEGGVVYAGKSAIYFPEGTENVTIKAGTVSVAPYAAYGNTVVKSVKVADSVEAIYPFAFSGCRSLQEFSISENSKLKVLGYDTFGYYTNNAEAPKIESIFIPGEVLTDTNAGTKQFYSAKTLKNVTFGDYSGTKKTYISYMMFANCTALESITIPSYVNSIETFAFWGCTALSKFTIPEDSELETIKYGAFGWLPYGHGSREEGTFHMGEEGAAALPSDLTEAERNQIEKYVERTSYYGTQLVLDKRCRSPFGAPIKEIFIPGKVLCNFGPVPAIFAGNTSLEKIKFGAASEAGIPQVGYLAFAGCSSLKTVEGLGNVKNIGTGAFSYCTSLENIDLNGVETTDMASFQNTGLKKVVIPKSLSNLGTMSFARCLNLTEMTYNTLLERDAYPKISEDIGVCVSNVPSAYLYLGDMDKGDISYDEFREKYPNATAIRTLKIGLVDGKSVVESVPNFAQYLSCLERVELPEGMKKIADHAFINNYNLKEVIMPESLEEIGEYAFQWDTKVDVDFSRLNNLKKIGTQAFFVMNIFGGSRGGETEYRKDFTDDRGIKEAVFADGLEEIGSQAFLGQRNLTRLFVPKSTKKVGLGAFQFTNNLAYVECESDTAFNSTSGSSSYANDWNGFFWNELRRIGEDRLVEVSGVKNLNMSFYKSNVETVSYPKSFNITKFDNPGVFSETKNLRDFVIPESITDISVGTFRKADNLETVIVPEAVEIVRPEAFAGSILKAIAFNNSATVIQEPVVKINDYDFDDCFYLNDGGRLVELTADDVNSKQYYRYNIVAGAELTALKAEIAKGTTKEEFILKYLEEKNVVNKSAVIYGYAESTAQKYAQKHGNPFVVITEEVDELKLDKNGVNNCEKDARFTIVKKSGEETSTKTVSNNVIPAKGHRIVLFRVGREATRDYAGRKPVYTCAHCNEYYEDAEGSKLIEDISKYETVVPKLDAGDTEETDDPEDPGEQDDPHKPVRISEAKAAGCTEPGAIDAWYCEHCDKYFSDSEGTEEIDGTSLTVEATGHDWDDGVVTTEPTATEEGIRTYTCKHDGSHTYTEPIPATGKVEELTIGEEEFSITFDMGDGTTTRSVLKKRTSRSYSLTNPVKEGYTFKGWYLDGRRVTSISTKYIKNHEDILITASWAENKYTIKYSMSRPARTARVTGSPRAMSVYYSTEVNLADNITAKNKRYNYRVIGWKDSKGNTYEPGQTVRSLAGAKKNKQVLKLKPIWEKTLISQ